MRNAEVIRQWQILREIESHRTGVTIHELAALVSVTTRTIRRDLQALQEAGSRSTTRARRTRRSAGGSMRSRSAAVQEGLSVADVAALYLSRALVEALSGWPLSDELRAAFAKIERGLNPRMREFLGDAAAGDLRQGRAARRQSSAQARRRRRGGCSTPTRDRRVSRDALLLGGEQPRQGLRRAAVPAGARARRRLPRRVGAAVRRVPHVRRRAHRAAARSPTRRSARRASCPPDLFGGSMGVFCGPPERIELEFDARIAPTSAAASGTTRRQLDELPDGRVCDDAGRLERLGAAKLDAGLRRRRPRRPADGARRRHARRAQAGLPASTSPGCRSTRSPSDPRSAAPSLDPESWPSACRRTCLRERSQSKGLPERAQ